MLQMVDKLVSSCAIIPHAFIVRAATACVRPSRPHPCRQAGRARVPALRAPNSRDAVPEASRIDKTAPASQMA